MTQSTEQEIAAAWNAQADEFNQWDELDLQEKIEWAAKFGKNQADRLVHAVPKGWKLVPEKHTLDMSIAFAESFYSKVRCIDDDDISDWYSELLAAAPQPPEAAPVQMPEPVAYLHECGKKPSLRTLEFSKVTIQLSAKGYKSLPLYTEHQVRQLLAAYGISN